MIDDVPLFDPGPTDAAPAPAPTASTTVRRTRRQRAALERGLHPATGLQLLADATCGDCVHCPFVTGYKRRYYKCTVSSLGLSASAASDIRISWPACERYEAPR